MSRINVAVVGVGNCAKSMIEGTAYHQKHPEDKVGLMYADIGGYTVDDLNYVIGFDIDKRKVGARLSSAIFMKPNCAMNMDVTSGDVQDVCRKNDGEYAKVYMGPVLDGCPDYMEDYPEGISFRVSDAKQLQKEQVVQKLKDTQVDVLLNYLPVGSHLASNFYIEAALDAGVHVVNCIPTFILPEEAILLEQMFINKGLVIVGSDMRSAWGASRMSEVLHGAMLDAGLDITQHIQMNMACNMSQGDTGPRTGRSANTDFLNMSREARLESKHISKENVIKGQSRVRHESLAGRTMYAGPSLTVTQTPGGEFLGSDNKVANFDMVAYGFGGSRYELTARLSVQDSPNSGGVVVSAVRFAKVASELGIVGYLRGPSAWTQKTPPIQMKTEDAKFECDALARRELTSNTRPQLAENNPVARDLPHGMNDSELGYNK